MKRLVFGFLMIAMLISLLAVAVSADDNGTSFMGKIRMPADTYYPGSNYAELVLNPSVIYNIWFSGNASAKYATVPNDAGKAVLSSNDVTNAIWQVQATTDGLAWTTIYTLISGSLTGLDRAAAAAYEEAPSAGYDISGYVGVRIGYDLTLTRYGSGTATCSGDGNITATAVPEPASLLTIGMGAVAMLLGRRKLA